MHCHWIRQRRKTPQVNRRKNHQRRNFISRWTKRQWVCWRMFDMSFVANWEWALSPRFASTIFFNLSKSTLCFPGIQGLQWQARCAMCRENNQSKGNVGQLLYSILAPWAWQPFEYTASANNSRLRHFSYSVEHIHLHGVCRERRSHQLSEEASHSIGGAACLQVVLPDNACLGVFAQRNEDRTSWHQDWQHSNHGRQLGQVDWLWLLDSSELWW